jgi:hypothetical protein
VKTVFSATGRRVHLLRCDGGTEYITNYLKKLRLSITLCMF